MKKDAAVYVGKVTVQRALGLLAYLACSGWKLGLRATVYFALYFALTYAACGALLVRAPDTLARRSRRDARAPNWDRALLPLYYVLAFIAIYAIAGAEAHFAPAPGFFFIFGALVLVAATALSTWALLVNAFLESTARLQKDRDQTVCDRGPYAFVRHPFYASILLWCVAVSLVFATGFVALTALVVACVVAVRTRFEDDMLKEGLEGYADYAARVRFRLVPGLW